MDFTRRETWLLVVTIVLLVLSSSILAAGLGGAFTKNVFITETVRVDRTFTLQQTVTETQYQTVTQTVSGTPFVPPPQAQGGGNGVFGPGCALVTDYRTIFAFTGTSKTFTSGTFEVKYTTFRIGFCVNDLYNNAPYTAQFEIFLYKNGKTGSNFTYAIQLGYQPNPFIAYVDPGTYYIRIEAGPTVYYWAVAGYL